MTRYVTTRALPCQNIYIVDVNSDGKVTVDLDVQVRDDLLTFLKEDSQHRNATILCESDEFPHVMELMPTTLDATHIFDGLSEFPTHVTHMRLGNFVMNATPWPLPSIVPQLGNNERAPDSTLFQIALQWLREDREDRQELEKAGRKTRGARRGQVQKRYRMIILRVLMEWDAVLGRAIKRGVL